MPIGAEDLSSQFDAEIGVIGIGVMGASTLWRIAKRGTSVMGIERFEPGHKMGSSHGDSRLFLSAYYYGEYYVPLVRESFPLWHELEETADTNLITTTGGLIIGAPDCRLVDGALRAASHHHVTHEVLDRAQFNDRFPQIRNAEGTDIAVYDPNAGFIRAEATTLAALAAAKQLGARVVTNAPAERISVEDEGVAVLLEDGSSLHFRRLVLATGAWLPRLMPGVGDLLQVERQVMTWFAPRLKDSFSSTRFPIFIRQLPDGGMRFAIPSIDGGLVKVGVHRGGAVSLPDAIDRRVGPDDTEAVEVFVRTYLPELVPKAVRAEICIYDNTPDLDFIIDSLPGSSAIVVLGGFSGHGFQFAPLIGDIAADLVLEGRTRHPIGAFAHGRFNAGEHVAADA